MPERVISNRPKERLYSIPRCKGCGLPLYLRPLFRWRDEGVITMRWFTKDFRFVVFYQELLNRIFDLLEEQFGKEAVDAIAMETEKGSASEYVSVIFLSDKPWLKPISYLLRYTKLFHILLQQNCALLGYGAIQVVDSKVPNGLIYVRNPYRLSILRADAEGVYEVARDRSMRIDVVPVAPKMEIYYFVGKTPDIKPRKQLRLAHRIKPEIIREAANGRRIERCEKCGIPRPISYFQWDERLGIIVSRLSGRRIILWPIYAMEKMISAFEHELGDEAREIITDITRKFWVELIGSKGVGLSPEEQVEFIEADTQGRYQVLLDCLANQGYGLCTSVQIEESPYRVRIELVNSSAPTIISGILAGMFEALEGREVSVSTEERPDRVIYRLS